MFVIRCYLRHISVFFFIIDHLKISGLDLFQHCLEEPILINGCSHFFRNDRKIRIRQINISICAGFCVWIVEEFRVHHLFLEGISAGFDRHGDLHGKRCAKIMTHGCSQEMLFFYGAYLTGDVIRTVKMCKLCQFIVKTSYYGQSFLVPLVGELAESFIVSKIRAVDSIDRGFLRQMISSVVGRSGICENQPGYRDDDACDDCGDNNKGFFHNVSFSGSCP